MKLTVNERKAYNLLLHAVKLNKIQVTDETFCLEQMLKVVTAKNDALEKEGYDVSTIYLNFATREALCLLAYISGHNGDTYGERSKWLDWESSIHQFNCSFPSILKVWVKQEMEKESEAQLDHRAQKYVTTLMNS